MKKLLSFGFALTLTLATVAAADASNPTPVPKSHMSMSHMSSMKGMWTPPLPKCPRGKTPVRGYTKKDGTKVASYCR